MKPGKFEVHTRKAGWAFEHVVKSELLQRLRSAAGKASSQCQQLGRESDGFDMQQCQARRAGLYLRASAALLLYRTTSDVRDVVTILV